jgi:hypothetical protein
MGGRPKIPGTDQVKGGDYRPNLGKAQLDEVASKLDLPEGSEANGAGEGSAEPSDGKDS